jgi:hypothetical protein
MPDTKPHPIDLVGRYLNSCRPPLDITTADIAMVIAAWNEIAKPLIEAEKNKAKAE